MYGMVWYGMDSVGFWVVGCAESKGGSWEYYGQMLQEDDLTPRR